MSLCFKAVSVMQALTKAFRAVKFCKVQQGVTALAETPALNLPLHYFLKPKMIFKEHLFRNEVYLDRSLWEEICVSVVRWVEYTGEYASRRRAWRPCSSLGSGPCQRTVPLNPKASSKLPFCSLHCKFGNCDIADAKHSEIIKLAYF